MAESTANKAKDLFKVLMVPSDNFGCGLYRIKQPAAAIAEQFKDVDVMVHFTPSEKFLDDEGIQLMVLQRVRICKDSGQPVDQNAIIMEAAKKRNIPVIYEHDDNDYALPTHHGMYPMFREEKITEKIDVLLKEADVITTTTPYIAGVFGKRAGNHDKVFVFPNCIHPNGRNWTFKPQRSGRLRIGWAGGSSHAEDLKELKGVASRLYGKDKRLQFMLGGFDTRGTYTYVVSGEPVTRQMEEHETIWKDMAATYFDGIPDSGQRLMRTLPVDSYGFFLSQFDIALVPLEDTEFTRSKSPLKLLECGAYGVPVVASEVWPYIHMVGEDSDVVKLVPVGDTDAWVSAVEELSADPVLRFEMGQKLKRLVLDQYNECKWAPLRYRFWKDLVACKARGDGELPEQPRIIEKRKLKIRRNWAAFRRNHC